MALNSGSKNLQDTIKNNHKIKIHLIRAGLIILVAITSVLIPWQIKQEYHLDFKEPETSAIYRKDPFKMSSGQNRILLNAAGSTGINKYLVSFKIRGAVKASDGIQPVVEISINGIDVDSFRTTVEPIIKKYDFETSEEDLEIVLDVKRENSVLLRYVKLYFLSVEPIDLKTERSIILPPLKTWLIFSLGAVLIFMLSAIVGCREDIRWLVFIIYCFLLSLSLSFFRIYLTIIRDNLILIILFLFVLSPFLRYLMPRIFKSGNSTDNSFISLLSIFILLFMGIKLILMTHPSLISADINYHVKNLRLLLDGTFKLETVFPGDVYRIPYPPLFYMLAAPFTLITANYAMILKILFAIIEIISPFLLSFLVYRLLGSIRAAFWTFIIYNIIPYSYRTMSAGFAPEMMSQMLLLLFFIYITLVRKYTLIKSFGLFLLITSILMSHFGGLIKFNLALLVFIILGKKFSREGWEVGKIVLVAFAAILFCYFIFYIQYNEMFLEGLKKLFAMKSPLVTDEAASSSLFYLVIKQIRYIGRYFFIPSVLSIFGLVLFLKKCSENRMIKKGRAGYKIFGELSHLPREDRVTRSVIIWLLLTCLIVFSFWWLTPLKVRWLPLLIVVVSILSAYLISSNPTRYRLFRIVLYLSLVVQFIYLLVIWYRLVFYFYRAPVN